MEKMKADCHLVVTKVDGNHSRVVQLVEGRAIMIEKLRFFPENAVGEEYGRMFEVRDGQLYLCDGAGEAEEPEMDCELSPEAVTGNDDTAQSCQQLSQESIVAMKQSGTASEHIISRLVEGSSTFKRKTNFAQEKYVKRKRRKHSNKIILSRPRLRVLAEIYYKKDTDKCGGLRPDLLAQILTMSNVQSGSRILVMEQCLGLVTAGLLERMGGDGMCVHVHKGPQPQSIPCVNTMDFSEDVMGCFYPLCLEEFFSAVSDGQEGRDAAEGSGGVEARRLKQETRKNRAAAAREALRTQSMQALVLALRLTSPLSALKHFLQFVAPSSPLLIYFPDAQPLLECYKFLKEESRAVNIRLTDSFFRYHQVLPERTHPEMNQFIAGGFLLTAITILPPS